MPVADYGPRQAVRLGVITGISLVYLALIGVFEQFSAPYLVAGILSIGHAVWFGTIAAVGYRIALARLGAAGILLAAGAGVAATAFLGALVLLGDAMDIRQVFVHASPTLYGLLMFGRPGPSGLALLLGSGALASVGGAALGRMPSRVRHAVLWGVAAVVLTATLEDLVKSVKPLASAYRALYTNNGLAPLAALTLFALAVAADVGLPALGGTARARLAQRPEPERQTIRRRGQIVAGAVVTAVLLVLPFVAGNYLTDVLDTIGLFVLMGLGLNIVVGYAGLLDLGYVAFYAIGAYTVAFLTSPTTGIGLGFWTALPLAMGLALLSGILLGIPVLRTRGDYLAIITLGFGEIIRILAISDWLKPWIGGAQGIKQVSKSLDIGSMSIPFLGRVDPSFQIEAFYPIAAACAVFTYIAWRLRNSRFGRGWMAIREDEPIAEALGIDLVMTKLFAFAAGAAMAGTAGALLAGKVQSIFPQPFSLLVSINVLVMIIIGGMGSLPGVYVGALVLVGLPEVLREFQDYRILLYGALLVAMMLKRPAGLWPAAITKREMQAALGPDDPPRADGGAVGSGATGTPAADAAS